MRKFILFGILYAAMLLVASVADAQRLSFDSSEKVHSTLKTDIPSDTSAWPLPKKVKVADGDGRYFKAAMGAEGRPYIVTFAPTPAAENANTAVEECMLTAVDGDSITIATRGEQNTSPQHWAVGSSVGIRVSYAQIGRYIDTIEYQTYRIDSIRGILGPNSFLPSQTGQSGKALTTNGSTLSWTAQPGSVVPVSLGGTNLTTLAAGKLLYASSTGVMSPLSLGSGLSILSGVLSASLSASTTDALAEGATNLYFTNTRAQAAIAAVTPVHDTGGVIYMHQASAVDSGWISPAQVNAWDAKQSAITFPLTLSQGGTGGTTAAAARYAILPDTTGLPDSVVLSKLGWVSVGGGGGGSGTVTSVTVAQSGGLLSLSGTNPITTSGTVTLGLASQSANLLFASPNGSTGAPTFRSMVAGDIPNSLVTNAKLANSSVTVTAGTGMTGGGAVALGAAVTLTNDGVRQLIGGSGMTVDTAKGVVTVTNAGVTSITGTANQVIASGSTGGITLSTPQSIGTGSSPTFAGLTLSSPLTPANGGTGVVSPTIHKLVVGNGTSAMTQLAVGTTNTVLHGNTAADPSFSQIANADLATGSYTNITGVGTLGTGTWNATPIATAYIADSNVTAVKIATGAVSLTKQVSGQLPTANIADSNVTAVKIATGAVSLTKQVSGQLPTANIADSNVTAVKIATHAVDLTQQVSGQLPTANIADSNVTAVKIATGAVSLTKQVSGQLPTANIADSNVTAVKIATGAVSLTKQVSGVLPVANGGTNLSTYTTGDLPYASAANTLSKLGIGSTGQVLSVSGGVPAWTSLSSSGFTSSLTDYNGAWSIRDIDPPDTLITATALPGAPQFTYAIVSGDIPSNAGVTSWRAILTIGGKNTDLSTRTINVQFTINGVNVGTATSQAYSTGVPYWTAIATMNVIGTGIVAGDVIGCKMWCTTPSAFDYRYATVYVIPLEYSKPTTNAIATTFGSFTVAGAVAGVTYAGSSLTTLPYVYDPGAAAAVGPGFTAAITAISPQTIESTNLTSISSASARDMPAASATGRLCQVSVLQYIRQAAW